MNDTTVLPAFDAMHAAVVERDPAFDGVFFTGVRTTGVFCRPTCHARNPLRGDVEFFASADGARRAGYRPAAGAGRSIPRPRTRSGYGR